MIDLKSKPFYLNDQQIRKVQSILDSMTLDEKIGQVFCPIGSSFEEKEIVEFIEKYKPGDSFQFVRNGYFCIDTKDSTDDHFVFNRIVSLKSSFKLPKK